MNEPLVRKVEVRCALEHAFATFTERVDLWWPRGHRRLSDSQVAFEQRVGGRFFERGEAGDEVVLGEVLRWEPPHRLTYSWYPGAIDLPTEVDVRFSQQGEVTLVEVVHGEGSSGIGDAWPERVKKFERGWSDVLPRFKQFIESIP